MSNSSSRSSRSTRLNELSACQAANLLARRDISAVDLVKSCLERVAGRDERVQAFTYFDADHAIEQAKSLDEGPIRGVLHGLPIGVKDLFDAAGFPASYGSSIYEGHRPMSDAVSVSMCRTAGALVLGKTVTTEFAYFSPGPTRNPHQLERTPGGSSSGSAAAVADFMVPLALGTQTAGSIIRPAAFCGVVGYKPSIGLVSRAGVKGISETLDTVGCFGRSVADVALLGSVLLGDMRLTSTQGLGAPRIGLCRTPEWTLADADTQRAWAQACSSLSADAHGLVDVQVPASLADLVLLQKAVMAFEMSRALHYERASHPEKLSQRLSLLLDEGQGISLETHIGDLQRTAAARRDAQDLFKTCDVLLAPSAIGEAPPAKDGTGDPVFCRGWTLLGLPCVHLPFSSGRDGLPVGLQLVGQWGQDHLLLAHAQWVFERLEGSSVA